MNLKIKAVLITAAILLGIAALLFSIICFSKIVSIIMSVGGAALLIWCLYNIVLINLTIYYGD